VIALLAVERDVLVAKLLETLQRKRIVDAFRFLQTQHIRPHGLDELRDKIDAQAHRIDIPGGEGEAHDNSR